jgi:hypothetical protein
MFSEIDNPVHGFIWLVYRLKISTVRGIYSQFYLNHALCILRHHSAETEMAIC